MHQLILVGTNYIYKGSTIEATGGCHFQDNWNYSQTEKSFTMQCIVNHI